MKIVHIAFIVAASVALAAVAFGPGANARGGGHHSTHGVRGHFSNHLHAARPQNAVNAWPFYGGLYALPSYASQSVAYPAPVERIVFVPEAPRALACKHSVNTVTVTAEAGGTRDITVTRC